MKPHLKKDIGGIPPSMYDEIRNHIQELLDIGAIRPSQSPWASAVRINPQKGWETTLLCRPEGN